MTSSFDMKSEEKLEISILDVNTMEDFEDK